MKEKDKIIIEVDEDEFEEKTTKRDIVRVLVFSLGDENYCVDIKQVREVLRVSRITKVPNTPAFISGVMNLRGDIISLIDIKWFFGLDASKKSKSERVIVTNVTGSFIGILIDGIKDAIEIDKEKIQPPLATLKKRLSVYTKGQMQLGDDILILLDLERILKCDEIEELKKGGM